MGVRKKNDQAEYIQPILESIKEIIKKNDGRITSRISDKKSFLSFFSGIGQVCYVHHIMYIICTSLYVICTSLVSIYQLEKNCIIQ